jgi:hypothetical protein
MYLGATIGVTKIEDVTTIKYVKIIMIVKKIVSSFLKMVLLFFNIKNKIINRNIAPKKTLPKNLLKKNEIKKFKFNTA